MERKGSFGQDICLGTHDEDYGSWMSNPVFYVFGGVTVMAAVAAVLSHMFHITVLVILFSLVTVVMAAMLIWIAWIRRKYAFDGGGIMGLSHSVVLSQLEYDGRGDILEVGCGSGALAIRAALTWPDAKVTGVDSWKAIYDYSIGLCEKNAVSEGVASRCSFRKGDAKHLDFADESFDAVISNYVYHNILGSDMQKLLLESLRVLKKGGVFAINDNMKPKLYGDMEAFCQKLRSMGYREVRLVDTAVKIFGSRRRAKLMMLGSSCLLVGRK